MSNPNEIKPFVFAEFDTIESSTKLEDANKPTESHSAQPVANDAEVSQIQSVEAEVDTATEEQLSNKQNIATTGDLTPQATTNCIPAKASQTKSLSNEEVMEHTASLWKYIAIPESEPEPFAEYINSTESLLGSKVTAARVRGKKHKHEGTNCDDWYEVADSRDITFIAVSDGAGSKRFSRIGAREACKAAIGYLVTTTEKLREDNSTVFSDILLELSNQQCMNACGVLAGIIQQAVIQAHEAVETAYYSRSTEEAYSNALGRSLEFKDFSGTLLLAALIPINSDSKEHLIITCQIGDGMIAILNSKGKFSTSLKLMGEADSGDFSGETDFLTSSQMKTISALQSRTKITRVIADTVLVMTDGVSDDYFPNETELYRLYLDLIVNGIISCADEEFSLDSLTAEQMKIFKRIPDPLVYPWVNDQSVKIPIQYVKRISEATGLSLEKLWEDSLPIRLANIEMKSMSHIEDISERLKIWLDNYVERGSFDDRTLVIAQM